MNRREFFQQVGWMLAALGVSNIGFEQFTHRYYQALAQPAKRKLALLVGINEYPGTPLAGCITDVALQRELLITRFGFDESAIVTLTDQQATRHNIETTFLEHLSQQAQPGDLVVIHFSGYGSEAMISHPAPSTPEPGTDTPTTESEPVADPPEWQTQLKKCLVPVDGMFSAEDAEPLNVILHETLGLLLRTLATEQVITVLDTSYNYLGKDVQGNLRVRSRPSSPATQLDPGELTFQDQLLQQLKLSRTQWETEAIEPLPGLVLTAAGPEQLASESQWDGFNAGLFTYHLTQSLWWATPATKLSVSFSRGAGTIEQLSGNQQQPQLSHTLVHPRPSTVVSASPARFTSANTPAPAPSLPKISLVPLNWPADGKIIAIDDNNKTLQLWLAGLPACLLEACNQSYFAIFPTTTTPTSPIAWCQIRSRSGITAKAQVMNFATPAPTESESTTTVPGAKPPLAIGQCVQEMIRVIPRQINLRVALDPVLTRIERVDATSGFANIPDVSVVVGEQPADYIFSRVRDTTIAQTPDTPLPVFSQGRYGLFSIGQTLLKNTMGEGGEAVKTAVQRLTPQLQNLLAAKIFRLTSNEGTSRLKVKSTLAMVNPEVRVLMQRESIRAHQLDDKSYQVQPLTASGAWPGSGNSRAIPVLPIGSRLQCRLRNDSNIPVYYLLFCLDSAGRSLILDSFTNPELATVGAGEAINIPATAETFGWTLHGPEGLAETQLIFSRQPFTQTLAALDGGMRPVQETLVFRALSHPVKVAQAVLQDLKAASNLSGQKPAFVSDDLTLDVQSWASFSFLYRVA